MDYHDALREKVELAEVQRKVQDVSLREGRQKGVGADTFVVAVSFELGYVGRFEKWESDLIPKSRDGRVGENVTFLRCWVGVVGGWIEEEKGK